MRRGHESQLDDLRLGLVPSSVSWRYAEEAETREEAGELVVGRGRGLAVAGG